MRTIWKYQLPMVDRATLRMPFGAQVLGVQAQDDVPTLWALVNPETTPLERRTFVVVGTGHPVPPDVSRSLYVGTVQLGPFVLHVFECDVAGGR